MISVMLAHKEQCDSLCRISSECFSRPWSAQSFASEFDKGSVVLLAKYGDAVAGFAVMEQCFGDGYVSNVAVSEHLRGKGIARALVERLIAEAKLLKLERILLEVRQSNAPAIGLYRSVGFEVIATRRNFYDRPREDGYTMQLNL